MAMDSKDGCEMPKEKEEEAKKSDDCDASEDKMDKSMITEEQFSKSLDALEQITKSGPAGRKQELLEKALKGGCSDTESAELSKMLQGVSDETLSDAVAKSMSKDGNETFQKALDVSDYMTELHQSLSTNLASCAKAIEKSESKRSEETVILAKALLDIGKLAQHTARLVKSLQHGVGTLAQQPARAPKAVQNPADLAKSLGEQGAAASAQLSKADVLESLHELFQKSIDRKENGLSAHGEMYDIAASKYEQFNTISPELLKEVQNLQRAKRQGRA